MLTPAVFIEMLKTLASTGRMLSIRAEVEGEVVGMYVGACFGETFIAVDTTTDLAKRSTPAGIS